MRQVKPLVGKKNAERFLFDKTLYDEFFLTLGRAEQHGSILLKPCFGDDMMTDDIYRVS